MMAHTLSVEDIQLIEIAAVLVHKVATAIGEFRKLVGRDGWQAAARTSQTTAAGLATCSAALADVQEEMEIVAQKVLAANPPEPVARALNAMKDVISCYLAELDDVRPRGAQIISLDARRCLPRRPTAGGPGTAA